MKANELRIGNWVMYSSKIQVNENKIRECVDHPERFGTITLTEEWLTRFGFEQMKLYTGDNCFVKEKFCVLCDGELKNYDLRLTFDSDQTIRVQLHYVHQLQNIYFAITGEELNQNKELKHNSPINRRAEHGIY